MAGRVGLAWVMSNLGKARMKALGKEWLAEAKARNEYGRCNVSIGDGKSGRRPLGSGPAGGLRKSQGGHPVADASGGRHTMDAAGAPPDPAGIDLGAGTAAAWNAAVPVN